MMPFLFKLYCIMLHKRGMHAYLVFGLFAVYLINGIIAIPRNSVTYDEMDHWSYGKRILMLKPSKIYPYDDAGISPFYGINAIPRAVQQDNNTRNRDASWFHPINNFSLILMDDRPQAPTYDK